jgi:hypothetical protein
MMKLAIRDYDALPPGERNLLKLLLLHPERRTDTEDYREMARRVVAKLKVDYGQAGADPGFEALIKEMDEACPIFREMWRSPEIMGHSEGVHVEPHPKLGEITFAHSSYVVEGTPAQRVVIYAPNDPESAAKLDALRQAADEEEA